MIEYSFFLNLRILSSATLFTTLTDGDQTAVVCTSVAIAFATFMIIIFYHILVRVTKEQQRQQFIEWATAKMKTISKLYRKSIVENKPNDQNNTLQLEVELREPLLEDAN